MKKTLLCSAFALVSFIAAGQNLLTQNFDDPADLMDWSQTNMSAPLGTNTWALASATILPYFDGGSGAYNGAPTSFLYVNFNSTTGGTGTISNWLFTPTVNLQNGDVLTFYAIKGLSGGTSVYADGFEVRMSTNGDSTNLPSAGAADVGDFTTLCLAVNPSLTTNDADFPSTWTQYTYTVSGLSGPTDCQFAWRYYVTNAGPQGSSSDQIGIDAVSIDRPEAAVSDFFASNFSMYPNPASDVVHLGSASTTISEVAVTDVNGRTVQSAQFNALSEVSVNLGGLQSGMYFLKVKSAKGTGSAKIIKK